MPLYDYRVLKLSNKAPGALEQQLNEAASQGYRLVGATSGFAILERTLEDHMVDVTDPEEHARFFAEKAGWMRDDPSGHWQG
ncbi:MAG: hypothetical protein AB1758_13075 [Candidatus Eremiobacterota bacterium]